MAKITECVSSMTVKVNVGDYQSVDFFASLKAEVNASEVDGVSAGLQAKLVEIMIGRLRAHFKARGKKYTDAQICRMYGLALPDKLAETDFG